VSGEEDRDLLPALLLELYLKVFNKSLFFGQRLKFFSIFWIDIEVSSNVNP
jgi:hypothetical protein